MLRQYGHLHTLETQGHQPRLPTWPPPFLPSQVFNTSKKQFLLGELFLKHQQLPGLDLVLAEEPLYTSQFISVSETSWLPCPLLQMWVSEEPFWLILQDISHPLDLRVLVSYSPQHPPCQRDAGCVRGVAPEAHLRLSDVISPHLLRRWREECWVLSESWVSLGCRKWSSDHLSTSSNF